MPFLDVLETSVTIDDDCYKKPNITSDSSKLTDLRDSLNTYCKAVITYTFGEDKVVLDGTTIKEWCEIDGTHVELNEEKVREFVNSLAQKYDTFGMKRTLVTHSGEELTIAKGDYGWWMNRDAETEGLIEDIKTGENALAEHASTNQCLRKYSLEQSPLRINRSRKIRHGTTAAARTIIILAVENSC